MSCRRVRKESDELFYIRCWSLVRVRNQLPTQVVNVRVHLQRAWGHQAKYTRFRNRRFHVFNEQQWSSRIDVRGEKPAINITRSGARNTLLLAGTRARSRIRVWFFYPPTKRTRALSRLSAAPGDVPKDIRLRAKIAWRCQRQGWNEKKPVLRASSARSTIFYLLLLLLLP